MSEQHSVQPKEALHPPSRKRRVAAVVGGILHRGERRQRQQEQDRLTINNIRSWTISPVAEHTDALLRLRDASIGANVVQAAINQRSRVEHFGSGVVQLNDVLVVAAVDTTAPVARGVMVVDDLGPSPTLPGGKLKSVVVDRLTNYDPNSNAAVDNFRISYESTGPDGIERIDTVMQGWRRTGTSDEPSLEVTCSTESSVSMGGLTYPVTERLSDEQIVSMLDLSPVVTVAAQKYGQ